jgi:hypothetical protein
MGEAMKTLGAVIACLVIGGLAQQVQAQQVQAARHVAVAQFTGSDNPSARGAVLATLSDHDDVEVIGLEDIGFAAKRVKADVGTPAGRAKVAEELKIDAWIDGEIDGDEAHLTLTSAQGQQLASVDVEAKAGKLLDAMVGERMWAAMGTKLSRREGQRLQQLAQAELARAKLASREAELERQRALVQQREQQREQLLAAQEQLAVAKQAARAREIERLGEAARASKQALAAATSQPPAAPERRPAQPTVLAQARASSWNSGAPLAGSSAPPHASAWNAPAPGYAPNRVSPSTQRWLQTQPAPEQANPVPGYAASSGISPATQRWLAQQQMQQQ